RTMYQILDRIPRDEFEFIFFCGVPPNKEMGFEVVTLPTMTLPFNRDYKAVLPYFSKKKVYDKLDEFQPDIIHFASPSPLGSMSKQYGFKRNIPVVAIYHTHFMAYMKYYFRFFPPITPFVYKKAVKITYDYYKDPAIVYTPTKQIIDDLTDICKLDGKNLKLWQRGINSDLFSPNKRNLSLIRNITKNDKPNIIYASRIVWEKNAKTLILLYQYCEKHNLEANFIIVGEGTARTRAEQLMPNAFFVGSKSHEELSILYASSDIFLFPSDTETFGNVVIEAMASGLPCVLAAAGGPNSFVTHEETGLLCSPFEVEDYYEKITLLLKDDALRQKLITNGLEMTESLSWEKLVEVYFNDLRELARGKKVETSQNAFS
ncbi:MAG: glycosyltransferase, partial [Saprospiraceae bacterium]